MQVRSKEKEAAGIAEGRGGARGPENVWGSAATASICALLTLAFPEQTPLLALGYVASLATKLSDTCGSEIGKAYGKTPILITTLQQVPPGTEGAVSVEGTVAGIIGSAVLAAFAVPAGLINFTGVGIAMVAAFIACNVESFLGATVQVSAHPPSGFPLGPGRYCPESARVVRHVPSHSLAHCCDHLRHLPPFLLLGVQIPVQTPVASPDVVHP